MNMGINKIAVIIYYKFKVKYEFVDMTNLLNDRVGYWCSKTRGKPEDVNM
jgi:hypothetical protein